MSTLARARFRLAFCAALAAASRMTALNLSAAAASMCAHAVVPTAVAIDTSLERWPRTRFQLLQENPLSPSSEQYRHRHLIEV